MVRGNRATAEARTQDLVGLAKGAVRFSAVAGILGIRLEMAPTRQGSAQAAAAATILDEMADQEQAGS